MKLMREREREKQINEINEREKQREKDTERNTEKHRETQRNTEKHSETEIQTDRQTIYLSLGSTAARSCPLSRTWRGGTPGTDTGYSSRHQRRSYFLSFHPYSS